MREILRLRLSFTSGMALLFFGLLAITQTELRFLSGFDTSRPFVLLGFSPGGMICTEQIDHTIPVRNVKVDYLVPGGSHMMMLTRPEEINRLIYQILKGPRIDHEDH